MSTYIEKMQRKWSDGKYVCLGLDPVYGKLPEYVRKTSVKNEARAIGLFLTTIIDATIDIVGCYKPNVAFFERYGSEGYKTLEDIVEYIQTADSDTPVIFDGKRGDIGNTNEGYVDFAFDTLGVDACTAAPYMGGESLRPFLNRSDKTIFVLCRTSNPDAGEFQDITDKEGTSLYEHVLHNAVYEWSTSGNVGLVAGATSPTELAAIRQSAGPNTQLLVPGVGAQGGDAEAAVKAAKNDQNIGFVINSSRGILYASGGKEYAEAARAEAMSLNAAILASL